MARRLLQHSLDDVEDLRELRELGTGVFVDRPLGVGKPPGTPDQTPLVAHEAYSRTIARSRLSDLNRLACQLGLRFDLQRSERQLAEMPAAGVALADVCARERPPASLADARRVAGDFVIRRTVASSVITLGELFSFAELGRRLSLDFLSSARLWLLPVEDGRLVPGNPLARADVAVLRQHGVPPILVKQLDGLAVDRASITPSVVGLLGITSTCTPN